MQQEELRQRITGAENDASSLKHTLTQLAQKYPWFGAPHYFLLQQMEKTDETYPTFAAKTMLHFSSPFLLQSRLNNSFSNTEEDDNSIALSTGILPSTEYNNNDIVKEETQSEEVISQGFIVENNDHEEIAIPDAIAEKNEELMPESALSATTHEIPGEGITATENTAIPLSQKEEMIFEPLYSSDYFASQGIKLSEQIAPTDKLGMQVKSFTAWLRTMKKLPGSQPTQLMQVDNEVEQLAEKSNTGAEVLTETMADVFIQQGRKLKAIEIYYKLSLLNPSKSAFFAAKIEQLKNVDQ